MAAPVIEVRDLTFRYQGQRKIALEKLELAVGAGQRWLVVGANGAGKSTLLRILAGKHMVSEESVRVFDRSAFHDTSLAARVEYLGGVFPFQVDLAVSELLDARPDVDPVRRDRLVELLEIDRDWHMHAVSDGQRKRVQLLLGLMRPTDLLLLDEITTDLDLVARYQLLSFLREESEQRGATILYASHILDGLDPWATHIAYLTGGRLVLAAPVEEVGELVELRKTSSQALVDLVLGWLLRDGRR